MKFYLLINILLFSLSAFAVQKLDEEESKLFFPVSDFALPDTNGNLHQLSRKINSKYLVLYSYSIGCPIARKNLPDLRSLLQKFKKSDVDFYFIDSALQDTRELLSEEVKKYQLPFPILIDETQEITRLLKINRTAEVLIIDTKNFKIMYRGPVDDKQTYGSEKAKASKNYLQNALTALLSKKKINDQYVRSLGCALTIRPRPEVTFYKNIAPILNQKCLQCHQTMEIPPSNFFTYDEAKNWSTMIKEVIQTEQMPPWEVDPLIKVKNQSVLSREDKEQVYAWIESGMKEGDPKDYIARETANDQMSSVTKENENQFNGSYQMSAPVKVKADNIISWHYEMVDKNDGEDYWINSLSMQGELSSPNLIQHLQLIIAKEPIPEIGLSRNEFLPYSAYKKIHSIISLSNQKGIVASNHSNAAHRIPKGAIIYLQAHFAKTGKDEEAFIKVIMKKFAKKGLMKDIYYENRSSLDQFVVPANQESFTLKKEFNYRNEVVIFRVAAHMHARGNRARLYVKNQDDKDFKLVYNSRYIFKNRRTYDLVDPITVKKNGTVRVELDYDNSKANPAQIDYTKDIVWGEDAYTGEMMLMHLFYYLKE